MTTSLTVINTPNLSTLAGQREHYSAVRSRLWPKEAAPAERPRRIIPLRAQPHRPDVAPKIVSLPLIVLKQPRTRDWLIIRHNKGRASVFRNWRKLVRQICEKNGVTLKDVMSDFRGRQVVDARFECYWHMRENLKMSFPSIGAALGGKDHTTVLHGYRRHCAKLAALS